MHYLIPSRRSLTNLLQESGEMWPGENEEAPLPFAVLAREDAPWLAAVLRTGGELGPDDADFGLLPAAGLPVPDPARTAADDEAVAAFQESLVLAEGLLVLVDDRDRDDDGSTVVTGLGWAALPADEGALEALPVVVLGVTGDPDRLGAAVMAVRRAVAAGEGTLVETTLDRLPGEWAGRVGPDGRIVDLDLRQAIGQATLALRNAAEEPVSAAPDDPLP